MGRGSQSQGKGSTMQNIKNFKSVKPTPEQTELFTAPDGAIPIFLQSEDGQDWFECHSLFADDTIKIMYDAAGIIRSVVDAPVPERGNIYAVSMFFPEDMSVAEIAKSDYPEGVQIDGAWMFNEGVIVPVPVDTVAEAEKKKRKLLNDAAVAISPLKDAVDLDMATDDEIAKLNALKIYRVKVNRVDVSNPIWPDAPQ